MGDLAGSMVLAGSLSFVGQIVTTFCTVYIALILLYVLSGMVRLPYSIWLNRIQRFLYDVCEPYLRLFRRVLPPMGPLDLSPLVASLLLVLVASIVARYT